MVSTLLLALLALNPSQRDESKIVFRADVEAVQVDVYVARDGQFVHGLSKNDFALSDNGRPRDLKLMDVTSMPLRIALVLDTSASVRGARLENLQAAAHVFLDELEAQDRVSLVTFSQQLNRTEGSFSEIHTAIDAVNVEGWTAWRDALFAGLKTVEGSHDRPVVLLFTDGDDTYSWLREDQMLPIIQRSNASLYAIRAQDRAASERTASSPNLELAGDTDLLRELTSVSGGRFIETDSSESLREVFLDILIEMRTRYRLVYSPPSPVQEGWHDIEVKVKTRDAEVNARRGYFYETLRRPR